jgi:hypothetical protein
MPSDHNRAGLLGLEQAQQEIGEADDGAGRLVAGHANRLG